MSRQHKQTEVEPLKGLAPWLGGKHYLAQRILPRIEAIPHDTYCEPFIGMGGVFLKRRLRVPREVINDRNRDVANLFRVVKHHPMALLDELELSLTSRAELERLWRLDPEALTDVQRAARLFRIQRLNYGGNPRNRSFVSRRARRISDRPELLRRYLRRVWHRLADVTIECLDYQELIRRYDRPGTLFYLDPPYYGVENYYGRGLFERADFGRLAELLRPLQGRFLMSINDRPEIRRLFAWARLTEVHATYHIRKPTPTRELLIEGPPRKRLSRGV